MWGHDEGERGIALHPAMLRSEVGQRAFVIDLPASSG
jgi:hypothetical protein